MDNKIAHELNRAYGIKTIPSMAGDAIINLEHKVVELEKRIEKLEATLKESMLGEIE